MKPKTPTSRKRKERSAPAPAPAQTDGSEAESTLGTDEQERILARPDGYHWLAVDGRQEFGPFQTIDEALADMSAADDEDGASMPGEMLQDAVRDIGIAEWLDPDTGEPAEGQSPPHLEQD